MAQPAEQDPVVLEARESAEDPGTDMWGKRGVVRQLHTVTPAACIPWQQLSGLVGVQTMAWQAAQQAVLASSRLIVLGKQTALGPRAPPQMTHPCLVLHLQGPSRALCSSPQGPPQAEHFR